GASSSPAPRVPALRPEFARWSLRVALPRPVRRIDRADKAKRLPGARRAIGELGSNLVDEVGEALRPRSRHPRADDERRRGVRPAAARSRLREGRSNRERGGVVVRALLLGLRKTELARDA